MIKNIRLNTIDKDYSISIGNGLFKLFLRNIKNKKIKKYLIIDDKVFRKLDKKLLSNKDLHIIKINGSEKIKSIEYYWKNISLLIDKKIDRSSLIIAIGGGSLGDLCGFIASTLLRGVKLILIPTTLLSQVDSSVGGKNGINSPKGKNLIGTFYQPDKVIIDTSFLKHLPKRQIRSGYAEIVKHAIINDEKFYNWLKKHYKDIYNLKSKYLSYAIEKSIKIKAKFVKHDLNENLRNSFSRAMLNFGHTFGHALESLNNYKSNFSHGEAISIGMIIAAKISYRKKYLSRNDLDDLILHFKNAGLPIKSNHTKNKIFYNKIINDKKNINGKVNLILLKKIGKAFYSRNYTISKIKTLILKDDIF